MLSAADAVAPGGEVMRWLSEGERHARAGDYAWMAGVVPPGRVLEVGCGGGFSSEALCAAGHDVLVLEPDASCVALAGERLRSHEGSCRFLPLGVEAAGAPEVLDDIAAFAPQTIVCWLMGGSDAAVAAAGSGAPMAKAVQAFREGVHRHIVELAVRLPSVTAIHLVDRTAFPWKIKDTARDTLVLYHAATTLSGLPFALAKADTLYRKLDAAAWPDVGARGRVAGIVPVLGSLIARRTG